MHWRTSHWQSSVEAMTDPYLDQSPLQRSKARDAASRASVDYHPNKSQGSGKKLQSP
jgi:hypothetical protein